MNHSDKQTILDLLREELAKHWRDSIDDYRLYTVHNGYERNLTKQLVNYVVGSNYRAKEFDFVSPGASFDWIAQGMIAIAVEFFVGGRYVLGLDDEMMARCNQLRGIVHPDNVPGSLLQQRLA